MELNNKVEVLGITRQALHQLCDAPLDRIPSTWFQWRFRGPSGEIARVAQFEDGQDPAIRTWYEAVCKGGFAPLLLLAWCEDLPKIDGAHLRVAALGPKALDGDDHRSFQEIFSEPDDYVRSECWAVLRGGGLQELGDRVTEPGFWAAYGQGLYNWYESQSTQASIARPFAEFRRWQSTQTLGYDDFDFSGQHRFHGKPFFPMKMLPCCGLLQEPDGELKAHGLLPSNWAFDPSGELRTKLRSRFLLTPSLVETFIDIARRAGQAILELAQIEPGSESYAATFTHSQLRKITEKPKEFSCQLVNPTTSAAAPVKVRIVQLVTIKKIPELEPFELTTWISCGDSAASNVEIGMTVNGASPARWERLKPAGEVEIRQQIRAVDKVQYVVRTR